MNYINPKTKEVVAFAELRSRYRQCSLPMNVSVFDVDGETWALIAEAERPTISEYQILDVGPPVLAANKWQTTWVARVKPLADRLELVDRAFQLVLDEKAASLDFADITDAAGYVNSTNELWAQQAMALVAYRDAVWVRFEAVKVAAENGAGLPLPADLVAALPVFGV